MRYCLIVLILMLTVSVAQATGPKVKIGGGGCIMVAPPLDLVTIGGEVLPWFTGPKLKIGGGPAGTLLPSPGVLTGPKLKIGGGGPLRYEQNDMPSPGDPENGDR